MMTYSSIAFKSWHTTMERTTACSVIKDKHLMDVLCARYCFVDIVGKEVQMRRAALKFGTAPLT
jgi:hypothetical protein